MIMFKARCLEKLHAMSRPRRYLLLVGWSVVFGLLVYLAAKPVVGAWREARAWQALAPRAASFTSPRSFSAEQWQALASARRVVLTKVEEQQGQWQLQGELPKAEVLKQLMHAAQEQGAQVLQWGLEQREEGLSFSLIVTGASLTP
jgi:type II secretion system protein M (XcpZ-type)